MFKIFPSLLLLNTSKQSQSNKEILIHIRGGDYKKTLAKATKGYYKNPIKFLEKSLNSNIKKYIVLKYIIREFKKNSSSSKNSFIVKNQNI